MKKLIAVLMILALSVSLLADCGGNSGSSAPASSGSSTGSTGGSSAPASSGPVKIEFWHSMGSSTGELVQEIVDEFNASQDEVYVDCIYQGDYTTAGTKLQAAAAGGDLPHVVAVEITRVGMYASAGFLMDLLPYAESDPDFDLDALYPGVMDFSYYEGQLVSLPNGRSVPVMYYNVDALKAAGIDKAPETWDELVAASNAVTGNGV